MRYMMEAMQEAQAAWRTARPGRHSGSSVETNQKMGMKKPGGSRGEGHGSAGWGACRYEVCRRMQ